MSLQSSVPGQADPNAEIASSPQMFPQASLAGQQCTENACSFDLENSGQYNHPSQILWGSTQLVSEYSRPASSQAGQFEQLLGASSKSMAGEPPITPKHQLKRRKICKSETLYAGTAAEPYHSKNEKLPTSKNILRNMGLAQNNYIIHSAEAREIVQRLSQSPVQFWQWVRTIQLSNFAQFREIWASTGFDPNRQLYRQLCWRFYSTQAVPYIYASRIKGANGRNTHLQCIPRFLQAIANPDTFFQFK